MNIIHFTLGSVNPSSSNGVNRVIEGLSKYCNKSSDVNTIVLTLSKKQKHHIKKYVRDGFEVTSFKSIFKLVSFFRKNSNTIDIVHFHTVFSITNIIVFYFLYKNNIKAIVSPHSGFSINRLKNSNFILKKIFNKFIQRYYLDKLDGIHCAAHEEMIDVPKFTNNKNLFVVKNGIDFENLEKKTKNLKKIKKSKIHIGLVGRIKNEKNIHGFLKGISLLNDEISEKIRFIIIGEIKKDSYGKNIIRLKNNLKLNSNVDFLGEKYGEELWEILNSLDIYIQPSLDEGGASISIMEAMFFKLPIIATHECKVTDIKDKSFIKLIGTNPKDIANGLNESIENLEEFKKEGLEAHKYIKENRSWESIAKEMIIEYKSVIKDSD